MHIFNPELRQPSPINSRATRSSSHEGLLWQIRVFDIVQFLFSTDVFMIPSIITLLLIIFYKLKISLLLSTKAVILQYTSGSCFVKML